MFKGARKDIKFNHMDFFLPSEETKTPRTEEHLVDTFWDPRTVLSVLGTSPIILTKIGPR